ncbi:bifunctional riboflavin kinase/FAD synthetase [Caminibacter sp.]
MKITIGGFDGMHIAHQALIKSADIVFVIEKGSNLTPGFDRLFYTKKPIEFFELEKIKHLSPHEFIEILKKYKAKKIVIGEDFRFGQKRRGDIELLRKHFEVEVINEIKIEGTGVHSHKIRDFLKEGDIKKANLFLGRNYKIRGTQIKGQGLGRKELVPTINIELLKNYLIPKVGVYITKTNSFPSLTFIGTRSTDNNFSIETHILMENGQWKMENKVIVIEFLEFLRDNKRFKNLEELKNQIEEDIKFAKNYF